MDMLRNIIAIFILITLSISCGKLKGEFAFKRFNDYTYKKIRDNPEFIDEEEIEWIYMFNSSSSRKKIGLIYMKKEVVWVEIQSKVENIGPEKKIVYGRIKNLPEGEYQIILTEIDDENDVIDRKNFTIYSKEEDVQ